MHRTPLSDDTTTSRRHLASFGLQQCRGRSAAVGWVGWAKLAPHALGRGRQPPPSTDYSPFLHPDCCSRFWDFNSHTSWRAPLGRRGCARGARFFLLSHRRPVLATPWSELVKRRPSESRQMLRSAQPPARPHDNSASTSRVSLSAWGGPRPRKQAATGQAVELRTLRRPGIPGSTSSPHKLDTIARCPHDHTAQPFCVPGAAVVRWL